MRGRGASPALSENEYDVSQNLLGGVSDESDNDVPQVKRTKETTAQQALDDSGDEDELYIATQQAASNRKATSSHGGTFKKGGGFQSMGLNANLLKAITRKGFSVPTPIQRKTIPLILDGQDVVGMARTGSGKTAAFVIPMLEKLKTHSAKVGARAVVLSPSRELALQTLKVIKDFGRGTDLRTVLLVGGDSLEEQFSSMASNPDIIVATPGRFEHLKVEMGLELSSIKYVVFDEADRLFEMGFAAQLAEIIHALPPTRQTLLFSATLPKSLVEFARAGLQDPKLVRLDAESKMSENLQSAFFTVAPSEKEGALLHLLQDVIKVPFGQAKPRSQERDETSEKSKKRKRDADAPSSAESPTEHSTIVFAATKHHVDYLANMLRTVGYAVSYVYGTLDQTARKIQVSDFRSGVTNILVVTDVAARGIDIPILANVINYDFPSQPKIFVHRVGRTARAGQRGWSYSLVTTKDMPYLLDLQLFLTKPLIVGRGEVFSPSYVNNIVIGNLVRGMLERHCEEVAKLLDEDTDLQMQRGVAVKGEQQYLRTRNSASAESVKRAKTIQSSKKYKEIHPLFESVVDNDLEREREDMVARISGFRPSETVFEIGKRGATNEAADIMRKRRSKIQVQPKKMIAEEEPATVVDDDDSPPPFEADEADMSDASSDDLEITFSQDQPSRAKKEHASWQDAENFMSYTPSNINMAEEASYSVNQSQPSSFLSQARNATMDLGADESRAFGTASKPHYGMRWDRKSKKYVSRANDVDGSRAIDPSGTTKGRMMRGESGLKMPASLKAGRFERWKKSNRIDNLPRIGELERPGQNRFMDGQGRGRPGRFMHKGTKAPIPADKFRDDYFKKRKRLAAAQDGQNKTTTAQGKGKAKGQGKTEIKSVSDVHKARALQQRRKDKNARPSKKRH